MEFLSQVINGLGIGSIYALVALGYSMVYGIVQLINFAHGDIIMVGAYTVFVILVMMNLPLWLAVLGSILFCGVAGVLIERIAYRRLLVHEAPRISLLITAIGVSIFLQNLYQLLFGSDPKSMPKMFAFAPLQFGGVQLTSSTIINISVSVVMMAGLQLMVNKMKIGKAMRATSEDAGAAKLMGINTNTTIAFTFGIGSALAAVGAVLYCNTYPQIKPVMGGLLGLKAFVAAVLGGIGSIPGAMLGGYLLGVAESLTNAYISSNLTDAVVFGILIIVLLVKPTGLLGKNTREKV
ncbi:branched-chain amino acid ABC transporter permease [Caproiciproducens galactitolivorans]|jgi:branched-chain amino acid transport system permease protein|uniref:High-affinity branched-chain amino acid transport system permease protein LivH n=1 Tax=Caproiciproducens galactitolivorans TaxID=642589 RepID=A0A4Z0YAH4_9FIRM|nr:branched-chain amino acid ABC transporter permease [Caproiciproducens galactitolivorans]QEY34712.1 branched-chain amino acid ABC transporter permease [Caproiciproducens galactitolivorans]TGJ75813.1 high-affinity branched-chain amino acid transport system permease protein LivH [Caproiciproducens galactitolivorans]